MKSSSSPSPCPSYRLRITAHACRRYYERIVCRSRRLPPGIDSRAFQGTPLGEQCRAGVRHLVDAAFRRDSTPRASYLFGGTHELVVNGSAVVTVLVGSRSGGTGRRGKGTGRRKS